MLHLLYNKKSTLLDKKQPVIPYGWRRFFISVEKPPTEDHLFNSCLHFVAHTSSLRDNWAEAVTRGPDDFLIVRSEFAESPPYPPQWSFIRKN